MFEIVNKKYYPNGNPMCETERISDDQIIIRWWHENKNMMCERPYKNNQLHGIIKYWYSNGNIASEFTYRNNFRHGVREEYNKDGSTSGKHYYIEDKTVTYEEFREYELIEQLACLK